MIRWGNLAAAVSLFLALVIPANAGMMFLGMGPAGSAPALPTIVFSPQASGYVYPAAPTALVGNLTATLSDGTPLIPGGNFTLGSDPGCADLVIDSSTVIVGATNLTGSGTCTITAHYPSLTPVPALFSWNGTQQSIVSISPTSYSFVAPAGGSGATLGSPTVTMSGGISFAAGGGTLALGSGAQCADFTYSAPTLKTVASLVAGTYGCTLVATDPSASPTTFTQAISAVGSGATIVTLNVSDPNFQASTPSAPVGTLSCSLSNGLACVGSYSMISSGTDHIGTTCNASSGSQFAASGTTLQTNSSGLAAGTYTAICVQVTVSGVASPFVQALNLSGTSSLLVGTKTFYNNGASTTPGTVFPAHWLQTFQPGDVPVGSVAVPTVGGSTIQYGVDCAFEGCPTWPDGSLRAANVSAFLPALASKVTETVQFTVQAGSYPTSSTVTPATLVAAGGGEKTIFTDVNNSFVPEFYGEWLSPILQIGCHVHGGAVTDCPIRTNVTPPNTYGYTCLTAYAPSVFTGSISGTTLTVSTAPTGQPLSGGRMGATSGAGGQLSPRAEMLTDTTGDMTVGTILVKQLTNTNPQGQTGRQGTYQVNVSQSVAAETMSTQPCSSVVYGGVLNSNGNVNNAVFSTTLASNNFPASTTVISGGTGYSLIGSGTMTFDPNVILGEYGTNDPPSCAAELGAGVFNATYSGGALTINSTTSGHIANGQIVVDSTGATAYVSGTSSPWTILNNTGGPVTLTSGAMTANTSACVYAQSPTMKGYRVFGYFVDPVNGPDAWHQMTEYVELWSLAGAPFSIRSPARVSMPWKPNNYFPSDTYDVDVMNGTAEIRGAASGEQSYVALTDNAAAAWYTVDTCPPPANPVGCSAQADWVGVTPNSSTFWTANSRAWNSVVPTLLTTDKPYFRLSRVLLPLDDTVVPSPLSPPIIGQWDNPLFSQGYYLPLSSTWVDSAFGYGSGGSHFFLYGHGATLPYWYLVTNHAADMGAGWLQQTRTASLGVSGTSMGLYEGDTLHDLNVDPTFTNAAYTDPVRTNSGFSGNFGAGPTTMGVYGGQNTDAAEIGQTSHWPSATEGWAAYVIDGNRWQLDEMDVAAANALTNYSDTSNRIVKFGGNTYYGVVQNDIVPRTQAWAMQLVNQAAVWGMPNEPDTKYWRWIQNTNYTQRTAFVSYTGTFSYGVPTAFSGNKLYDWSTNGTPAGSNVVSLHSGGGQPPYDLGDVPWMDAGYWNQVLLLDQMWEDHFIPALDTFSREMNYNYVITMAATDPCIFNQSQYDGVVFGAVSDGLPNPDHDSSDLTGSHGNIFRGLAYAMTMTSGNPTITTNITASDFPASVVGTTPPSGSTVWPTLFNAQNDVNNPGSLPTPFNDHTHYTWCSLSATTGTLNPFGTSCSSPAPITPTSTGNMNAGWILNQACPAVNATNGAWSSGGAQGVGYVYFFWPAMNWWVAINGADANSTAAINAYSTLVPTFHSNGAATPPSAAVTHF